MKKDLIEKMLWDYKDVLIPKIAAMLAEANFDPEPSKPQSVRIYIEHMLIDFGMSQKLQGFYYITECVMYMVEHGKHKYNLRKTVYPEIAAQFGVKVSNLDRSIRSAIESVLSDKNSDLSSIMEYFQLTNSVENICTSAKFLNAFAYRVLEDYEF